jgi:glycosyltransferase involved in cell wall biosynthesis
MNEPLISIILPVYNQADHIEQIVAEYETLLKKINHPHELLLVVNGCRDQSLQVCLALAEQHQPVRVLQSQSGGWGLAVRLGIAEAKGELLCYTNSARTSPQDLVLLLLYATVYPNVVIKANRKIRDSWWRRLGSLLYNLECRAFFDLPTWDINGTPKVFPRQFSQLLKLNYNNDLIDAEFAVICRYENYPILEVPILSTRRHSGRSTTNPISALKLYWGAYQFWRSWRKAR